ncbi:M20 metallopeptidase family protein [Candidatus Lucifugimonas marina]|jgi:amidohydrolase|uniref:Amidohydrolase n=1 Tax=Candidatus Lucifugimonas marina TaxID=3038979 RepID=A0AAJ6CRH0_9CHLR|nr:amidohydrolase [SAR202 cluster bacterium JH702]MDG0868617.1 amidohydrolase [SAR202 cluster bacterium JH639]WFG35251.1 amidohydrolase [SAR202 cluster bacterium JH545]WFG39201.1 amidohydrolase [SAR202 cluster bacterium JH1073]
MTPDAISDLVAARSAEIIETRRKFHVIPELGFEENETAQAIADRLTAAGLEVETGIGKTGLVGVLRGANPGPTLMIRADIDGLPVDELTGLDFASTNGRMHACGHDGHITMALVAAEILAGLKDQLAGTLIFVFQPAEEIVMGALAMIDDGLFEKYPADRVIGTHLWNQIPTGTIGVNRATVFASADQFRLTVHGKGGHGAMPHTTIDPVAAIAEIISTAQTVVSREVPPNDMGVLTFGQIHGGSAPNVIADNVTVEGTVRAYTPETRIQIMQALERISSNVASAMRASTSFERIHGAPPVINNPEVAAWVTQQASLVVGEGNAREWEPVSVGDDMAEFNDRIPGVYFLLGAAHDDATVAERGIEGHHNAKFDWNEDCLPLGIEVFVRSAVDYLS